MHLIRGMATTISTLNDLTGRTLGAAIEVHRTLGPGLLESTYLQCLQLELAAQKLLDPLSCARLGVVRDPGGAGPPPDL